jgi:hypothetical protein
MRICVPVLAVLVGWPAMAEQTVTDRVVRQVIESPWAKHEDGFAQLAVEFYSRAIFTFSVKDDGSRCYFHFWREGRADQMLNRAFDAGCDGTVEAVQTFSSTDWEFRPLSEYEAAFYAYYMPRYAAVFEAVNRYRTYLPEARLALVPDMEAIAGNRRLLQSIADAATGSELMGVPREGRDFPEGRAILKIWVNGGREDGFFELAFSADKGSGGYLSDCYVAIDDQNGSESLLDENCDALPELWEDNRGSRPVSAAGNEQVVRSVLLELARFADVANAQFRTPDTEALTRTVAGVD